LLPFTGNTWSGTVEIPGRVDDGKPLRAYHNVVSPNYFGVLGIPIKSGRSFTAGDDAGSDRVVVINDLAAKRWWPAANAVGQTIIVGPQDNRIHARVVGIIRDTRLITSDTRIRPEVYFPLGQRTPAMLEFVAKSSATNEVSKTELAQAIWRVDPTLPVEPRDLRAITSRGLARTEFFSMALTLFAAAAIALSALGVYGLLAFGVTQRRREIGIRMALGARGRSIGVLVIRRGLVLGVAGTLIGLILARGLTRFMESVLVEVAPTDLTVFTAAAFAASLVAVLAACIPAYQAIKVDPIRSLRT
jgi:putative ABC transport system permease protein